METINIHAFNHFDPYDSYGLIACQLARHLTALGVPINAFRRPGAQFKNLPPDIEAIVSQDNLPSEGGIFLGFPTIFKEHGKTARQHPRIAITMFETTKLPSGWAEVLNDYDAVITPCHFCADVFRTEGITASIHVIPLGIGERYTLGERTPDRPLTFLAWAGSLRKGWITAKNCFLKAFGDDTNYRLVIKQRQTRVPFSLTNPNITWLQEDMSEEGLYRLYLDADVMIAATRGEGFGLLPREFAATGGISLATNWGGTADDLESWGWPLPYTLAPARWGDFSYVADQDTGLWAEPDEEGIVARLKQVAVNIEPFRRIACLQAPHVAEMYSWRKFAEGVLQVWEQVSERVTA